VQVSTNLVDWTDNWSRPVTVEVQTILTGDGMESVTVRSLEPVSGLPAHFMRVQVTLGP